MDGWGKHGLPPTSLSLSLFLDLAQNSNPIPVTFSCKIGYREYNNIGCLVNYEYVYRPGGSKVYGTGGRLAMGQSKIMFTEQIKNGCLEGIDDYG